MAESGFTYRIDPGPAKRGAREVVKAFDSIERASRRVNSRTVQNTQKLARAFQEFSNVRGPNAAAIRNVARLAESLTNFRAPTATQTRNLREFFNTLSRRSDNANVVRGLDRIGTSASRLATNASNAAQQMRQLQQEATRVSQVGQRVGGAGAAAAGAPLGAQSGRSTAQNSRRTAQATQQAARSTRAYSEAATEAVSGNEQLAAGFRRTAQSVAVLQGPLGPIAGRITTLGVLFGQVGVAATTFGVAMTGLGTAIGAAATASARAESQFARLNAILDATGNRANQSQESIEFLSRRIGRDTLANTQQVRNAAAQLLTFRNVAEESFTTTIELAQDLAAVGFGTITSSATQLAKALEDPSIGLSSLRRSGVNFTKAQKDVIVQLNETGRAAEAQARILEEVSKQVGGAGVAAAQGLSGATDTLTEEIKLLFESIGQAPAFSILTDAVNLASGGIRTLTENASTLTEVFRRIALGSTVAGGFFVVGRAAQAAAVGIGAASTALRGMSAGAATATVAMRGLGSVLTLLSRNPIFAGSLAIGAFFATMQRGATDSSEAILELEGSADRLSGTIERLTQNALQDPSRNVGSIERAINGINREVQNSATSLSEVTGRLTIAQEQLDAARRSANETVGFVPDTGSRVDDAAASRLRIQRNELIAEEREEVERLSQVQERLSEEQAEAAQKILRLTRERQNLLRNDIQEQFWRAEVLGIQGAEEALVEFNRQWERIQQQRQAGNAGASFGADFLETFERLRGEVTQAITPLNTVKDLTEDLDTLAENVIPSDLDSSVEEVLELENALSKVSDAQLQTSDTVQNISSLISENIEKRRRLNAQVEDGIENEAQLARTLSELAQVNRTITSLEDSRNEALADGNTLAEQATAAQKALRRARDAAVETVQEDIATRQEFVAAARGGQEAVDRLNREREREEELQDVVTQLQIRYGQAWRQTAEAVQLYNRARGAVDQQFRAEDEIEQLEELRKQIEEGPDVKSTGIDTQRDLREAQQAVQDWVAEQRSLISDLFFFDDEVRSDLRKSLTEAADEASRTLNEAFDPQSPGELLFELDPTLAAIDEFNSKLRDLQRVRQAGLITAEREEQLRARFQRDLDEQIRQIENQNSATQRAREAAEDLGFTFTSAFEDAIVAGEGLREILKGVLEDVQRILIRTTVSEPLAGKLSEGIGNAFTSGGLFGGGGGGTAASGGEAFANALAGSSGGGGGFFSNLFGSADGNVFTNPSVTRIAERGEPEAVFPLTRMGGRLGIAADGAAGGGGENINIVNNYDFSNSDEGTEQRLRQQAREIENRTVERVRKLQQQRGSSRI